MTRHAFVIFLLMIFFSSPTISHSAEATPDGGGIPSTSPLQSPAIQAIADYVKSEFQKALKGMGDVESNYLRHRLGLHYNTFRLCKEGVCHPAFADQEKAFFPEDTSAKAFHGFIDQIAHLADQNAAIRHMLSDIPDPVMSEMRKNLERQKPDMMLDAVTYAMALERMTDYFKRNMPDLKKLDQIWAAETADLFLPKHLSPFEWVKYHSVGLDAMIDATQTSRVDPDFLSFVLPANILEATLTDIFQGNFSNARAGWVLAVNGPGRSAITKAARVLPMPAGYQAVESCCPFPRDWADLYGSWNLAFVATYSNAPYFMAKLLIPSVLAPTITHPTTYMFHRGLPLYFQLRYILFNSIDQKKTWKKSTWNIPLLIAHMGKKNAETAALYRNKVKRADKAVAREA
ncbi:hypothetical protein OAN22_01590 [Alphaproteobacteria bacterium]|nr:hypothetical protein [Alphaproteobacteria bacterium]